MKQHVIIIIILFSVGIVTAAFQCSKLGVDTCTKYTNDTAIYSVQLPNYNQAIKVLDTFNIQSIVNDSITTVKGLTFLPNLNQISTTIQAYKVEQVNQSALAYYANIQFNYIITEGYFNTNYGSGFSVLYNRVQPQHIFKGALVCGSPGLYVVKIQNNSYSYNTISNPIDKCYNTSAGYFVDRAQQQLQYWDSLHTTSLLLANGGGNIVANKSSQDYFFIKVNP
jgi:hypothetical protein